MNFSTFSELGDMSTISAVLYANQNHPELKIEYPQWSDRYKQIMKKWRALSSDKKAPYLQRARDNRSAQQAQLRTKKAQQVRFIQVLIFILFKSHKTSSEGSILHICISSFSLYFDTFYFVLHNHVICFVRKNSSVRDVS